MYYQHFELSGAPFLFTPSTSVLYLGKAHRECLAALEWALLHESCGFMLLTGETGVGKTTLLCTILSRGLSDVRLACVTNPKLSFEEIMRVLLKQLGSTISFGGRLELIDEFERIIAGQAADQRTAVIIDEAQDLSDETLEDVRLLANCAESQLTGLQFVLMGQPELLERLAAPNLRQIRERISAKATLVALNRAESIEYVECRLKAQHGKINRIFEHDALLRLADASAGIPRRLNVLCHNALLVAYSEGAKKVDVRIAEEVIKDFEGIYLSGPANLSVAISANLGASTNLSVADKPAEQKPARQEAPILLEDVVGNGETEFPRIEEINRAEETFAEVRPVEAREAIRTTSALPTRKRTFARSAMVLAALFIVGLSAVLISAENATGRSLIRSARLIAEATMSEPRPVVASAVTPVRLEVAPQPSTAITNDSLDAMNASAGTADAKFMLSTPEFIPSIPETDSRTKIQVGAGDTLHDLAKKYLGTVDRTRELIAINPQIKNPDVLYPGDAVYLPSSLDKSE